MHLSRFVERPDQTRAVREYLQALVWTAKLFGADVTACGYRPACVTEAEAALKEYAEGTYPEALANARTTLKMAEITLRNKEEELEQTRNLYAKGFVTGAEVKADELTVTVAA